MTPLVHRIVPKRSTKIDWPTRDEWAKRRRTLYYDMVPDARGDMAYYATPQEIANTITALKQRWKDYGQQMQTAKSAGDNEAAEHARFCRQCINRGLKLIGRGELPILLHDHYEARDILAPYHERHEAERRRVEEEAHKKVAATPIDDAAWEAELQRRTRIERM